jgi:pilus assembly protein CpaD
MAPRTLLALALAAGLSACAADLADYDPHQRYQVQVQSATAAATVAVPLGATDAQVVRDLAEEHRRRPAGPVTVEGAGAETVAAALAEAGVPAAAIRTRVSEAAATTIRVPVWVAKVPECGKWETGINPDFANQNTPNFGCAVTRNIGLMVSDPADLVRARTPTGRDGNRAVDVLTKYGEGKYTASQAEPPAPAGTISVVGQ